MPTLKWTVWLLALLSPAMALGQTAEKSPTARTAAINKSWIGLYTSPKEIAGFSGTVLSVEKGLDDHLRHTTRAYSDSRSSDAIDEPETNGEVISDGDKLYVATAYGFIRDKKPRLHASLTCYTRLRIRGRTVLLREDALRAYRQKGQLYDYGILIKVSDKQAWSSELEAARHESIKILYRHPSQKVQDPFVHGPNAR